MALSQRRQRHGKVARREGAERTSDITVFHVAGLWRAPTLVKCQRHGPPAGVQLQALGRAADCQ